MKISKIRTKNRRRKTVQEHRVDDALECRMAAWRGEGAIERGSGGERGSEDEREERARGSTGAWERAHGAQLSSRTRCGVAEWTLKKRGLAPAGKKSNWDAAGSWQ